MKVYCKPAAKLGFLELVAELDDVRSFISWMFVDAVVVLVASLGGVQRLIFVCARSLFLLSCAG